MGKTSIEWCDHSINPLRARHKETGALGHFCLKISPGCALCYAARLQKRFGMHDYHHSNLDKVELFLDESKIHEVLKRKKPTRYFWCDMTDMFLYDYPFEWIDKIFATMALTPQHTHMVLTKRPERMREYLMLNSMRDKVELLMSDPRWIGLPSGRSFPRFPEKWPLPNVQLGISAENQQYFDKRIDHLLKTPAAIRFVSYEPALGPLDVSLCLIEVPADPEGPMIPRLNWVIVGGESGPRARPFNIQWARSVVEQCKAAGVACFVKQLGAYPVLPKANGAGEDWPAYTQFERQDDYYWRVRLDDRKGGDWSEWPEDLRVREFPK